MSDEDLERLELYHRGGEINDPFFASVLVGKPRDEDEEDPIDSLDVPADDLVIEDDQEE